MTCFGTKVATSTLGDAVEMRIDDEIEPKVDDTEVRRGRTTLFKYMNGQIELCLIPHTEVTRFGLDHSCKVFSGIESPIGKIHTRLNVNDADREVVCFIENKETPEVFILFSYKAGEVTLIRHMENGSEHEIYKNKNIFDINLIDWNSEIHGHDAPKDH